MPKRCSIYLDPVGSCFQKKLKKSETFWMLPRYPACIFRTLLHQPTTPLPPPSPKNNASSNVSRRPGEGGSAPAKRWMFWVFRAYWFTLWWKDRWLATPKRWRFVRGHDKPIHGSCAIYFPGGIFRFGDYMFLFSVNHFNLSCFSCRRNVQSYCSFLMLYMIECYLPW